MNKILTIAALSCLSVAARAAEFTLLIYEKPAELRKRNDPVAAKHYWGGYNQFAGALAQAGVLRGGTALGASVGTPPKADNKDRQLGGYFVINVSNAEAAQAWAAKAAKIAASVVVVPHVPNPTMAAQPSK